MKLIQLIDKGRLISYYNVIVGKQDFAPTNKQYCLYVYNDDMDLILREMGFSLMGRFWVYPVGNNILNMRKLITKILLPTTSNLYIGVLE
jgi:hypothetical protein